MVNHMDERFFMAISRDRPDGSRRSDAATQLATVEIQSATLVLGAMPQSIARS
jgi:hypothetical protein